MSRGLNPGNVCTHSASVVRVIVCLDRTTTSACVRPFQQPLATPVASGNGLNLCEPSSEASELSSLLRDLPRSEGSPRIPLSGSSGRARPTALGSSLRPEPLCSRQGILAVPTLRVQDGP